MSILKYRRGKVIRDPIHGLIEINEDRELIMDLIDTPEFQRLRRVRQLGVSHLTYPGAEHTRFAHSLGVFHVANRILSCLAFRYRDTSQIKRILSGEKTLYVKVAALLHDVGHGPFSHASERAFESTKAHEERSISLIRDKGSAIHDVLEAHFGERALEEIWQLLEVNQYPFLHDIISSQLDADRMDYLLRDSHSAGVRYGHYDPEWLYNSFCLGMDPALEGKKGLENYRLCLDKRRGEHAASQLLIARMHMSFQVYFHRATRCWEAHLLCLFAEAARLASKGVLPSSTMPAVRDYFEKKGAVDPATFLQLDDACIVTHMHYWSNCCEVEFNELANLSRAIICRKSRMRCKDLSLEGYKAQQFVALKESLARSIGPEKFGWILDKIDFRAYKAPSIELKKTDPGAYWEEVSRNAIFLSDGEDAVVSEPIQSNSALIHSLGVTSRAIHYLFYNEEHEEKISSALQNL